MPPRRKRRISPREARRNEVCSKDPSSQSSPPFAMVKLDEAALRGLLEFHLSNGTNGIVPCGTTGESPTLSHDEYERVIEITVEMVHGRLPVIAGTGFNATDKTSKPHALRKKPEPTVRSSSRRTITAPPPRASISTSRRSPRRWISRSSSTIFQVAREPIFCPTPWHGWPASRPSWGSKKARAPCSKCKR